MEKIPLTASLVDIASPVFTAITQWQFEEDFVARILTDDIPQRMMREKTYERWQI